MLLPIEYKDVVLGMLLSCLNYLCSLRDENIINAVQSTGNLGEGARWGCSVVVCKRRGRRVEGRQRLPRHWLHSEGRIAQ